MNVNFLGFFILLCVPHVLIEFCTSMKFDLLYLQRSTGGAGKREEARSDEAGQSSGHTGSGANTGSVSGNLSTHTQLRNFTVSFHP